MFMQHLRRKMHRFSSVFSTYRIVIYIIILLPVVKVIVFVLWNTSDSLASNSRTLAKVHDYVNSAFVPVVTDSSGEYRIVKWLFQESRASLGDTTLISQGSTSQLHHFVDLRLAWDGPMSLAVFVESSHNLFVVVNYLLKLQLCLPYALRKVSIQLVMPLSTSIDCCSELVNVSCSNFLPAFDKLWFGLRNYDGIVDYPANLLRNVAVSAAISDYIFVIDIDMIPSSGLFDQFREFISKQPADRKIAYVVPVFEMQLNSEIPADRVALLQMWDHGVIQPFYKEVCWKCQRYTDYNMWRNLTLEHVEQINAAYVVEWHDPWEPFYIVDLKAPKYDEKFKNYGFNRISQACEMNIAGYQFAILDAAFLIHKGFKSVDGFHSHKYIDQNSNRQLYRAFKRMLKIRYPSSSYVC